MEKLKNLKNYNPITIYRGRIKSIVIFEIWEHELESIENGEKRKTYEKWGSNLLSGSLTLLLSWLTGDFGYEFLNSIILLAWFTGIIVGIILLVISRKNKKDITTILDMIRQRHIIKKSGRKF